MFLRILGLWFIGFACLRYAQGDWLFFALDITCAALIVARDVFPRGEVRS